MKIERFEDIIAWQKTKELTVRVYSLLSEKCTSDTTSTLSSSDDPEHGDFIINGSSPYDWRNPQNDNLWQGVSGTNNPCPSGYRLPTEAEWEAERQNWSSNNTAGAFASPLKLPLPATATTAMVRSTM